MKVTCSDCGATATGNKDDLIDQGWSHGEGIVNGNKFAHTCCKKCYDPVHFVAAVQAARHECDGCLGRMGAKK